MNKYIKIPRGIHLNVINDNILREIIEHFGREYNHTLSGQFRSDYAKGKAFLARKYNISKAAIKHFHTPKMNPKARNKYGDSYSNILKINIEHFQDFFNDLIGDLIHEKPNIIKFTKSIHKGKYTDSDTYMTVLFEESEYWMDWASRDDNIAELNSSDETLEVIKGMISQCHDIDKQIGAQQ